MQRAYGKAFTYTLQETLQVGTQVHIQPIHRYTVVKKRFKFHNKNTRLQSYIFLQILWCYCLNDNTLSVKYTIYHV